MKRHFARLAVSAVLATTTIAVFADFANGPNPYAADLGFDLPSDASAAGWGGWTRGAAGTIWAEWDQFDGAPNPRTPDIG